MAGVRRLVNFRASRRTALTVICNTNMGSRVPLGTPHSCRTVGRTESLPHQNAFCANKDNGGLVVHLRISFANERDVFRKA